MNKEKLVKTIVIFMLTTGIITSIYEYNNNINFRRETNSFVLSTFLSTYYNAPEGYKYSDFNSLNTYYVHTNGKRKIISVNKEVEGYNLLGVYDSKNSADSIFYYEVFNGEDAVKYVTVSYDDLEKDKNVLNVLNDLTLIDENSDPSISAYIPNESICDVENYSKTLS